MPTYTYYCKECHKNFELFFYIKDYIPDPKCADCGQDACRSYVDDVLSQVASVRKSDNELKTIGDLADRNRDRLTDQQKMDLYVKHNSYKESFDESKPLPTGMSRVKKQPKTLWPGSSGKKKRGMKKKHG